MKWHNLKNTRCPKCNANLSTKGEQVVCNTLNCRFVISHDRMQEIVANMVSEDLDREPNNFREEGWG